jgi:hypothetical protein
VYQATGSSHYIRDSQSGLKLLASGGGNYIESATAGMTGAAPFSITDMNAAHTWLSFDTSGNAEFLQNVGIGAATTGGTNGIFYLSYNGNITNMLVFANTFTGGRKWGFGDDTGNTCTAGKLCIYDFTASATRFLIDGTGKIGIGTTSPAATLDVAGYMRLAKNSSQPAACSATNDGAIALNHGYTLCVCKSGTGWVTASNGSTSCTW